MAGTTVGSAEFLLTVDQRGFVTGFQQAERVAAQGSAKIAQTIDTNLQRAEQSSTRFGKNLKSALEIGAGFAGVTLGLQAVSAAMTHVIASTQKMAQAQFAVNKLYGAGAAEMQAYAAAQANLTGRSVVEFQKSTVLAKTLAANYGLTAQQIQTLITRSADLAAVQGIAVDDAAQRVIAALRGEGEAAEALGLTLNSDAVKAMANMTEAQRKNFETLDQNTKAQIIFNEFMRQSADAQGAATERANSHLGAFDRLGKASEELAATIGTVLLPGLADLASDLAGITSAVSELIAAMGRLEAIKVPDWLVGKNIVSGPSLFERIFGYKFGQAPPDKTLIGPGGAWINTSPPPKMFDPRAADEGPREGQGVTGSAGFNRARRAEEKRAAKETLDERKKAVEAHAEVQIRALERERDAAEKAFAAQRAQLQKRKDAEIRAAEESRDAAIEAIEQQAQATADAYERQIRAAEASRDAEKQASDDKRDDALRALDEVERAARAANAAQIRDAETARDAEKQASEDRRDAAIKALEDDRRARDNARILEDRAREDETRDVLREIERQHKAAIKALDDEVKAVEKKGAQKIRALEREADAARRSAARRIDAVDDAAQAEDDARDAAIRALEQQADAQDAMHRANLEGIEDAAEAEAERHRAAMQGLEDEFDAATAIIDAQLKALDAQEDTLDAATRLTELRERATAAQAELARATGTGTPAQINEAREELVRALRTGNDVSVGNARDRLATLAGQGAAAVEAAQKKLTEALAEIEKEQIDQARDAQRTQLKDKKDAIRAGLDAEKRREDELNRARERQLAADREAEDERDRMLNERLDAERRAVDDRSDLRAREFDAERESIQRGLQSRLDALNERKEAVEASTRDEIASIRERRDAVQEAHDRDVENARDAAEVAKRAVEDRRRVEDQADAAKRTQITETYDLEQRQIRATYDDEITGIIPALQRAQKAAEEQFRLKRQAVTDAYDEEQRRIRETYDGPTGIIQKMRDQAETARREYAARTEAVNTAYNAEKDRIREVYDDPEHGLFKKLEDSKAKTLEALADQVQKWRDWKRDVTEEINQALTKLEKFLEKVGALDKIGTVDIKGEPVGGGAGGRQGGPGGDLSYGPVVRNASPGSYWTSGGTHGGHPAADIFAPTGSPIYAPVSGTSRPGRDGKGGNWTILNGDDGRSYYFAHGHTPFESGRIERGQAFGQVGNTGNAQMTAPHLHFAIATRPGVFGELGGSGDINGDSSYWGAGGGADEEIEITLFGRRIRIRTAGANIPGQVGRWIREGLALANAPGSWALPIGQIVAAESGQRTGDGGVVLGSGDPRAENPEAVGPRQEHAYGLPQILPSTFAENAVRGSTDISNPVHQIAAMARYITRRYDTPHGTPYFSTGAFDWRGVRGYRHGVLLREPTLLAGLYTGRMGMAGETGQPERLLGVEDTRAYDATTREGDTTNVNVYGAGTEDVASKVVRYFRQRDVMRGATGVLRGH